MKWNVNRNSLADQIVWVNLFMRLKEIIYRNDLSDMEPCMNVQTSVVC